MGSTRHISAPNDQENRGLAEGEVLAKMRNCLSVKEKEGGTRRVEWPTMNTIWLFETRVTSRRPSSRSTGFGQANLIRKVTFQRSCMAFGGNSACVPLSSGRQKWSRSRGGSGGGGGVCLFTTVGGRRPRGSSTPSTSQGTDSAAWQNSARTPISYISRAYLSLVIRTVITDISNSVVIHCNAGRRPWSITWFKLRISCKRARCPG